MTDDVQLQGFSQNRRYSIVIDEQDKVWAPKRRTRTNSGGSISEKSSYSPGRDIPIMSPQMQEVHVGHSEIIRRKSITYLRKELENDYHEVELGAILKRFGTHPRNGLSEQQVQKNLETWGKNELTPPKQKSMWVQFFQTLVGGFQLLLWAGAFLCFGAYIAQCIATDSPPADNVGLGATLSILALILGLFTFYQEYSCNKVMESFSKMVPTYANVIRDGKKFPLESKFLAVGDIVELKFGDRIPADIRLLECNGFKVDNSSLSGESEPQSRGNECTDENPLETRNLAFFSTVALEGTAIGLVVCVGDSTVIGRIAGLASGLDSSDTPMAKEISHFIQLICSVAVFFGLVFFFVSYSMGYSWMDSTMFLIGVIIANVPEGLLVTFTVILALTAKRMADKNCLVRQLHAVETLGSTSVICSDKTGTLTQNKMTATNIWINNFIFSTDLSSKEISIYDPGFRSLSRVAILCSRARFFEDQDKNEPVQQWKVNGDASESAILRLMETYIGNVQEFQFKNEKIFEIPFNSAKKWQLSIHITDDIKDPRFLLVMKGAPENIVEYCNKIQIGNKCHDLDSNWKLSINQACLRLADMGERVLGFSEVYFPNHKFPRGFVFTEENIMEFLTEKSLTFVGLISMVDPPRSGVPGAIQTCRSAGIKVVMVTGDHPATAKAIAKSVGIISEGSETIEEMAERLNIEMAAVDVSRCNAIVVKGSELLEMTSDELQDVLKTHNEIVFARVSPQQKLVIVEAFQKLGHIVAVTGDGVNDSPALKKADIGIAMGIAGSDVSKQAADMILLDDDFTSIVYGVEEGRLIFDNLKKCICYLLTANTAELLPFAIYFVFKVPLPLGTIPMLMVCLGTDILPTISLSYEKAEADIMKRPPRNPAKDKLVTDRLISYSYGQLGIIEAAAAIFTYLVVLGQNGFYLDKLLGIQPLWDSEAVNDLEDSYGQEWTYYNRKRLEKTCWTASFCAIVVCQWGNVIVSKMRRLPVYTKLFDNWVVYAAIIGETALACFLAYTPTLNEAISYLPIRLVWWCAPVPFCLFLIIHDEIRRCILRNCPSWKWYQHEFYY